MVKPVPKKPCVSEHERKYRRVNFSSDVDSILNSNIVCTSCNCSVKQLILKGKPKCHPLLDTLLCNRCHTHVSEGEFSVDEDRTDKYCCWCGQEGTLIMCSQCTAGFCKKCLKRNLPRSALREPEQDGWECFCCNVKPLYELRGYCWIAKNYEKIKKSKVLMQKRKAMDDWKPGWKPGKKRRSGKKSIKTQGKLEIGGSFLNKEMVDGNGKAQNEKLAQNVTIEVDGADGEEKMCTDLVDNVEQYLECDQKELKDEQSDINDNNEKSTNEKLEKIVENNDTSDEDMIEVENGNVEEKMSTKLIDSVEENGQKDLKEKLADGKENKEKTATTKHFLGSWKEESKEDDLEVQKKKEDKAESKSMENNVKTLDEMEAYLNAGDTEIIDKAVGSKENAGNEKLEKNVESDVAGGGEEDKILETVTHLESWNLDWMEEEPEVKEEKAQCEKLDKNIKTEVACERHKLKMSTDSLNKMETSRIQLKEYLEKHVEEGDNEKLMNNLDAEGGGGEEGKGPNSEQYSDQWNKDDKEEELVTEKYKEKKVKNVNLENSEVAVGGEDEKKWPTLKDYLESWTEDDYMEEELAIGKKEEEKEENEKLEKNVNIEVACVYDEWEMCAPLIDNIDEDSECGQIHLIDEQTEGRKNWGIEKLEKDLECDVAVGEDEENISVSLMDEIDEYLASENPYVAEQLVEGVGNGKLKKNVVACSRNEETICNDLIDNIEEY